jgi:hypothetical protein
MTRSGALIQQFPDRTSSSLGIATLLTAALTGAALATNVPYGLALLCAAFYLPIAVLNLPLAVALWVPLVFLGGRLPGSCSSAAGSAHCATGASRWACSRDTAGW